jgi:hypothetical protein
VIDAVPAPTRHVTRREWTDRLREAMPLIRSVFLLWLGIRAAYAVITYVANDLHLYTAQQGFAGGLLAWQRWDANWYMLISRLGYATRESVNFFPLHPMVTGALAWLLGDGSGPVWPHPDPLRLFAGMAVSNFGLLAGLLAIARLAQLEAEGEDADAGPRAARMVLAYPFAMAWTIAYSDGLFLGLAAATLLFCRRGYWYLAALTAGLAGLTRPVAVVLVLPLLWEFGRQHGWWRWPCAWPSLHPATLLRGALAVGAVPLAMGAYFGYVWWRFGDPFLIFHNLRGDWNHEFQPQWWTVVHGIHRALTLPNTSVLAIELALLAAFSLIVLVSVRRVAFTYTLWVVGLLFMATVLPIPQHIDLLWGTGRYISGAIPIYLIIGRWTAGRPWLDSMLFGSGMLVQGALTIALFQSRSVF